MISAKPTNDAGRLLLALDRMPEGATVEQLSIHLFGQPAHPPIRGTYAEKAAIRREWQAQVELAAERNQKRTSTLARELARRGLVERQGPPHVAEWAMARIRPFLAMDLPPAEGFDRMLDRHPAERRLLARLVTESPLSRKALGLSSRAERVYDRLVADGLIVAPSLRVLTGTGRALVDAWRAA